MSYETIRRWGSKFGAAYAKRLRRKRPFRKDVRQLDEVAIPIGSRKHWLWRAVDQDGYVLDEIVQSCRDTKAAKRLLIRLMKKQGVSLIDRQLGREVAGIMQGGSMSWQMGRQRGSGL